MTVRRCGENKDSANVDCKVLNVGYGIWSVLWHIDTV